MSVTITFPTVNGGQGQLSVEDGWSVLVGRDGTVAVDIGAPQVIEAAIDREVGRTAIDRAVERMEARLRADDEARAREPIWQDRPIWFWQANRYMRDGWTINQRGIVDWRRDWLPALLDAIRPCAVRTVDPDGGERCGASASAGAATDPDAATARPYRALDAEGTGASHRTLSAPGYAALEARLSGVEREVSRLGTGAVPRATTAPTAFPLDAEQLVRGLGYVLHLWLDRTSGRQQRPPAVGSVTIALGKAMGVSLPIETDQYGQQMLLSYGERPRTIERPDPLTRASRPPQATAPNRPSAGQAAQSLGEADA